MEQEEKVRRMFITVHGEITGSCSLEIDMENQDEIAAVWKDGNLCWSVSLAELVFDYATKHWK